MAEEENQNPEADAAEMPAEKPPLRGCPPSKRSRSRRPLPAERSPQRPRARKRPEGGEKPPRVKAARRRTRSRATFSPRLAGGETEEIKIHKAKKSKHVTKGIVHIIATFNNTVVTVTDPNGNAIGWSTAGKMGFKGSPQEHGLRRAGGFAGCLPPGDGPRSEGGRSPRQGPGFRP